MQLLHKKSSTMETTLTIFKQRKQLTRNLKFHPDTAAIFSQMVKTLIPWHLTHNMTSR